MGAGMVGGMLRGAALANTHTCMLTNHAHTHTPLRRAAIEKLREQNARLKEDLLLENKFSV